MRHNLPMARMMMVRFRTVLFSSVLMVLFSGCRQSDIQPKESLSSMQQDLFARLSATETDAVTNSSLAEAVHLRVEEYYGEKPSPDSMLGTMIDSAVLYLSSRLFMEKDPGTIVRELTTLIFEKWGITFNDDRNNSEYLFPHNVLKNRQGSCVGIALLYLLIAEKNGTPLFGVLVPGHFYVRFDDGKTVIAIETLKKGENMTKSWYRERFGITDTALYDMRNLRSSEVAAVLDYNIGTIFLQEKKNDRAVFFLERSIGGMPDFAEAEGNLAIALNSAGKPAMALRRLLALKKKYPSLRNIDRNVASLQLTCNDFQGALKTYETLLENDSSNSDFLYGKGLALYRLGFPDEAEIVLRNALKTAPDSAGAEKLLKTITESKKNRQTSGQ